MALRSVFIPNPGTPFNRVRLRSSSAGRCRVYATLRQVPRGVVDECSKQLDVIVRRSANWPSNIWDYEYLGSLGTEYGEERFVQQISGLKEQVKGVIRDGRMRASDKLGFIDAVQRLGLGYHFEADIKEAVGLVLREVHSDDGGSGFNDLCSDALLFRLSRQHGFRIRQDVLERFLKNDEFRGATEEDVVQGMLSLYEASFHGTMGESIVDEAKIIALNHLKNLDPESLKTFPCNLAKKVEHALDMPLRWRSNRSEARWFMDIYAKEPAMVPELLKLAKLDYNLVQSHHRAEVAQLSSWWLDLGLGRFDVLRDRLMENYLWNNITTFEPRWGNFRVMTAKLGSLITIIDDVYDIFGTMEELELLTDFIDRWDISEIGKLPLVIRASYMALYSTTNEIAHGVMRDRGVDILPYLQTMWSRQCKGYLREAKWYNSGYASNFEEYISNGTITIGSLIMLFSYFVGTTNYLDKEALDYASRIPPIVYNSSLIVRLNNDLATSPHELERGDNLKAVQCYENEHGVSNEEAREAVRAMVEEAWKSMNQLEFEEYPSFVSMDFLKACLGIAQSSQFFYQRGDRHGSSNKETKDYLTSLVVEPVSI